MTAKTQRETEKFFILQHNKSFNHQNLPPNFAKQLTTGRKEDIDTPAARKIIHSLCVLALKSSTLCRLLLEKATTGTDSNLMIESEKQAMNGDVNVTFCACLSADANRLCGQGRKDDDDMRRYV